MEIPLKTAEEHKYTSTGIKFWRHPEQMNNYKIGDSVPAQHWYEEKWLNWTPNTMNLEPAANYTHRIPKALPYDMPIEMREYMDGNPIKNS